jgi:hypothetical protein
MGLQGNPLEAISCLLACGLFISAERLMAKTVVSAVKPGGQALEVCPSGFLVLKVALASFIAPRSRGTAGAFVPKSTRL